MEFAYKSLLIFKIRCNFRYYGYMYSFLMNLAKVFQAWLWYFEWKVGWSRFRLSLYMRDHVELEKSLRSLKFAVSGYLENIPTEKICNLEITNVIQLYNSSKDFLNVAQKRYFKY